MNKDYKHSVHQAKGKPGDRVMGGYPYISFYRREGVEESKHLEPLVPGYNFLSL